MAVETRTMWSSVFHHEIQALFKLPCIYLWRVLSSLCDMIMRNHSTSYSMIVIVKPKIKQFTKQTSLTLIGRGEMVSGIKSIVIFDQRWDNGGKHLPWWWHALRGMQGTSSRAQAIRKPAIIYRIPICLSTWTKTWYRYGTYKYEHIQ